MPTSWGEREMFCATAAVLAFFEVLGCPSTVKESIIVLRNMIPRGCGSGDAF